MAAKEVSFLMAGEDYQRGLQILPVIVWSIYFSFIHQFPVNFELYCKKPRIVAAGTVLAAIINIILNALFIPRWGMCGAGAATAASYFCLAVGHFFAASHLKNHQYHLSFTAFMPGIVVVILFSLLFYWLDKVWLARWCIALLVGLYELYKVYRRKSIF